MATPATQGPERRSPGDLLLHPVALVALAVVIVNDRVLKVNYPSDVSGKLSDFAGLVYFPLFLVSVAEGVRWIVRRRAWELSERAVWIATGIVGVAMTLIKTSSPAGEVYRTVMGIVLWPVDSLGSAMRGDGLAPLGRAGLVQDRTDLFALVVLCLPIWVGHRVMRTRSAEAQSEAPALK